jgi:hypothetical protein
MTAETETERTVLAWGRGVVRAIESTSIIYESPYRIGTCLHRLKPSHAIYIDSQKKLREPEGER